jgi:hypothetical protein
MPKKPEKPHPPLSRVQAEELARIAASEAPTTSGTLIAGPLSYWGLIANTKPRGYSLWVATPRGRAWLASYDAYRAAHSKR